MNSTNIQLTNTHSELFFDNDCEDWTQCTDASSGHPYYWNIVTKDVTWEMPMEYQLFLEQTMQQNSYSLKKWILCYTDDNAPYYFDEITREISWEKPIDFNQTNSNPQSNNSNNIHANESRQSNSGNIGNVSDFEFIDSVRFLISLKMNDKWPVRTQKRTELQTKFKHQVTVKCYAVFDCFQ